MIKNYIKLFNKQLYARPLYQFSQNTILEKYQGMAESGKILSDDRQLNAVKQFDKLRNVIMSSQSEWSKFQVALKEDIGRFDARVKQEAAASKAKTKEMFDGMNANNKFKKKSGMFGFLQSNEQPIWNPIKDHNMTSHKQTSHRYDFSQIESYPLKKHEGLYLYGHPGSGKTFMMDLFYDSVPIQQKYRIHFNSFMSEISQEMVQMTKKGIQEPQKVVALQKCLNTRLLCLDEFQVTDIANAMILKSLFEVFIKNNVVVVATSNRIPDDLYKGGLQRDLFLPFIPFLKQNTEVINVQTRDYRKIHSEKTENYFYPLDLKTETKMIDIFSNIAGESRFEEVEIEVIKGRSIKIKEQLNGVAMFHYNDIILENYASTDFIALCKNFHTFILTDVPQFTLQNRDAMRRFILFVDEVYNASAKLYISAEKKFDQLFQIEGSNYKQEDMLDEAFTGHDIYDEEFAFQRTLSRVTEMQSKYYQEKPTLWHQLNNQNVASVSSSEASESSTGTSASA